MTGALLMLVAGQTILSRRFSNLGFLLYWMVCIVLTGIAMVLAVLELGALRRQTRREHRKLLEQTLGEIERQAKEKPPRIQRGPAK